MLDVRTIIILGIFSNIALGLHSVIYDFKRKFNNGLYEIGIGLLVVGIALFMLVLRGVIPTFLTINVANALTPCGVLIINIGISKFKNQSYRFIGLDIAMIFFVILGYIYFTYFNISVNSRIIISDLITNYFYIRSIILLNKNNLSIVKTEFKIISFMYMVMIVINTISIITAINVRIDDFMTPNSISGLVMLGSLILPYNLIVGIFWIMNKISSSKLQIQAMTDPLTNVFNRAAIEKIMFEMKEVNKRIDKGLCVVMCDIDFFKSVNDNYGHDAGDLTLIEIARLLNQHIEPVGRVARLGGDEFLIIIGDCQDMTHKDILENLRKDIENHIIKVNDQIEFKVAMSFGVYVANNLRESFDDMLNKADEALYIAKEEKRNQVIYYK